MTFSNTGSIKKNAILNNNCIFYKIFACKILKSLLKLKRSHVIIQFAHLSSDRDPPSYYEHLEIFRQLEFSTGSGRNTSTRS